MDKRLLTSKLLALFAVMFLTLNCYAQLPAFTLTATSTPQTCLGNGSLSFTATGTVPGATLDYAVYLLPNLTTPVAVVTSPSLGSLVAGNYSITATQSLAGQSSSSTTTVTIADQVVDLTFTIVPTKVRCGNDGVLTVNVTSGTPVQYEITSGPVTRPLQASNVFNNLPIGQYVVRVYDNCGVGVPLSFQLIAVTPMVVIQAGGPVGGALPSCNMINIQHNYSTTPNNEILFPVTFQYTIFPPGGGTPIVVTQVVASGSPTQLNSIASTIPFFYDQQYTYNILVTDACGNPFVRNGNVVNQKLNGTAAQNTDGCADFSFGFTMNNYVGPLTFNFTASPAGFVPANFNAFHPTIANPLLATYGGVGNSVPAGNYTVQVTDSCNRSVEISFEISPPELQPQIEVEVLGCTSTTGSVEISIPGRQIVAISITDAPAAYTGPSDVISSVIGGVYFNGALPLGTYTFTMTDSCGDTYEEDVEVEPSASSFTLSILQRPGCVEGQGSIRLRNDGGIIAAATIQVGPPGFPAPANVTANIAPNGMFYMNSLPEGLYTFFVEDECGGTAIQTVQVEGYHHQVNNFTVVEYCGKFDLAIAHVSNGNYVQSFWLQAYDDVTDTWGHPQSGAPYTEGTLPNATNSVFMTNNFNNINQLFTGTFRVVKAFYVYSNASSANALCTEVLHEFVFDPVVAVNSINGIPCPGSSTSEVWIDAVGMEPLTYAIVDENNNVLVDNGTSNVFTNLAIGNYIFRVTDNCNAEIPVPFDVNDIAPLSITPANLCEGQNGTLTVTQFSFLTYEWTKGNDPTVISTSSVLNLAPFDSATHSGMYYVKIINTMDSSCMTEPLILEHEVSGNAIAEAGNSTTSEYCNAGEVLNLTNYLTNPHDVGGTWTDADGSGALSGDLLTTAGLAQGTYNFVYKVTGDCDSIDEAIITIEVKDIPLAPAASTTTPVICEGGDIFLSADVVQDADGYQWTGPGNFTSSERIPSISQADETANGIYYVSVVVNGCVSPATPLTITVNALPDFTIEGDTTLCLGQTGGLAVNAQNFDTATQGIYTWYFDNVLQTDVTESNIVIATTGFYKVVVDLNGCISEKEVNVIENTNAFDIELEAGCQDFEYVVSVLNASDLTDISSYNWSGPGGYTAVGPSITITNGLPGDYTATVVNADGCTVTETINVPNTHCSIPKGISPGDADYNNEFDLSNLDVQHLTIFNRYGLEVYDKANYVNEWHGQSKSGDLPTGTYYYVVTLSAGKRVTGWVYLQRSFN